MLTKRAPRFVFIRIGGIGDIVTLLPAARLLRQAAPDAQIDIVASRHSLDFAQRTGVFDNAYAVRQIGRLSSRSVFDTSARSAGESLQSLSRKLSKRRYDIALETVGFFDYQRIVALATNPRHCIAVAPTAMLGPNEPMNNVLVEAIDRLVQLPPEVMASSVQTAWEIVRYVIKECALDDRALAAGPLSLSAIEPASADRAQANVWKSGHGVPARYVAFHPCAADPLKNWPPPKFAELADRLINSWDVDVIVTGSVLDRPVGEAIRTASTQPARIHVTGGELTFGSCAALYEEALLMVTVDTAGMHLADAVGCPLVGLFLPWPRYTRYLPLSQPQSVVFPADAPADEPPLSDLTPYVARIEVDQVIAAISLRLPSEPPLANRGEAGCPISGELADSSQLLLAPRTNQ